MSIDSATDKDVFLAFVVNVLVPTLRPGDIVVLDNLGAHKSAGAEAAIRSAGAEEHCQTDIFTAKPLVASHAPPSPPGHTQSHLSHHCRKVLRL